MPFLPRAVYPLMIGSALLMFAGGVNGLIDQTRTIERIVAMLGAEGVAIEGSDSLDDPDAVFQ